jgi:hypothetical protein
MADQFQMPFESPSPQSPPLKGGEVGGGYPSFFIPSPLRPLARSQRLIEGEGKAYGSEPTAHRGEGDLTYEETLLLGFLRQGKDNARGVKFLASMMKMSEVELRGMVRHLIMEHKFCIGSNTNKCPGYYIISQPDELDKNYVSLRRRGIKILMRAAEIKRISLEEVFQQGRMEFEHG